MITKQAVIAVFLGATLGGGAYAAESRAEKYYEIDEASIKIEELAGEGTNTAIGPVMTPAGPVIAPPGPVLPGADNGGFDAGGLNDGGSVINDINDVVDSIGNIVNLADQVWSIIEKNKPVVDINVTYANAVPFGTTHWTQLQGWSKPATKKYSFSANNKLGEKALDVTYQVHWTYGGNFKGKGKFLTGVTIEPLVVSVPWSHKVSLKAEVPDSTIANVGTSEDPIAAMQVQLTWTISSPFSAKSQKVIYYVQGDGLMEEIGAPFTRGAEAKSARETEALRQKMDNVKF